MKIERAVICTRRVRIKSLPPETEDEVVSFAFSQYGEINDMKRESWFKSHRYKVSNGVRIVMIVLTKHITSHMTIAGYKVLVSYEEQPITCYGCGETRHLTWFAPRGEEWG